jgi:enoyl-[acyl-carrier-protein] reductase (NADH)
MKEDRDHDHARYTSLAGKRGLVVGIDNADSIAAGRARAFAARGAMVAATYLNAKARPHVVVVTDPHARGERDRSVR